jgi:hypothetical protein
MPRYYSSPPFKVAQTDNTEGFWGRMVRTIFGGQGQQGTLTKSRIGYGRQVGDVTSHPNQEPYHSGPYDYPDPQTNPPQKGVKKTEHEPGLLQTSADAMGNVASAIGSTNQAVQGAKTLSQNFGFNQPPSQADRYNTFMDSAFPGTTQWERMAGGAGNAGISAQSSRDVAKINQSTQLAQQANSRDMLGRQLRNQFGIRMAELLARYGPDAIKAVSAGENYAGITGKGIPEGVKGQRRFAGQEVDIKQQKQLLETTLFELTQGFAAGEKIPLHARLRALGREKVGSIASVVGLKVGASIYDIMQATGSYEKLIDILKGAIGK